MSTERDELAEEIAGYRLGEGYYAVDIGSSDALAIADDILAAGYRKPRTVSTVEELDALPQETVVLDCDGDAWQKNRTTGTWSNTEGATQNSNLVAFYAPLTVLSEGAVDSEYHQHHGPQSTCTDCGDAA